MPYTHGPEVIVPVATNGSGNGSDGLEWCRLGADARLFAASAVARRRSHPTGLRPHDQRMRRQVNTGTARTGHRPHRPDKLTPAPSAPLFDPRLTMDVAGDAGGLLAEFDFVLA
jgi:hypothetical protein